MAGRSRQKLVAAVKDCSCKNDIEVPFIKIRPLQLQPRHNSRTTRQQSCRSCAVCRS